MMCLCSLGAHKFVSFKIEDTEIMRITAGGAHKETRQDTGWQSLRRPVQQERGPHREREQARGGAQGRPAELRRHEQALLDHA